MRITEHCERIRNNSIALLISAAFLFGGTSLAAAPKETRIGGNSFAARIIYELDTKDAFTTSNEKSHIGAMAAFGARLFKKNTPYLAEGKIELGNYGSYKKKKMKIAGREYNVPSGVDVNKRKNWELRSNFRIFGVTLVDKLHPAPQSVTGSSVKKEWKPFRSYKYKRKDIAKITFMVGPVPFGIRFGASGGFGVEPKFGFDLKKLGVDAELKPSASASAYAEGGPNIYVLRGGVGVKLNLIQGAAGVKGILQILGDKSFAFKAVASLKALSGEVYAFVDRRKYYVFGKWKRWIYKVLHKMNGALNINKDKTICRIPLKNITNGSFKCEEKKSGGSSSSGSSGSSGGSGGSSGGYRGGGGGGGHHQLRDARMMMR